MATFRTTTESEAVVPAEREAIWDVLTDPDLLTDLTPMLRRIEVVGETDGDPLWRWSLAGIDVLGVRVERSFTVRMRLDEPERITFEHAPPSGTKEKAGVDGWYALSDRSDGDDPATHLAISLTLSVDLPLPKATSRAVKGVIGGVMEHTGERFAANLLRHLDAD